MHDAGCARHWLTARTIPVWFPGTVSAVTPLAGEDWRSAGLSQVRRDGTLPARILLPECASLAPPRIRRRMVIHPLSGVWLAWCRTAPILDG